MMTDVPTNADFLVSLINIFFQGLGVFNNIVISLFGSAVTQFFDAIFGLFRPMM